MIRTLLTLAAGIGIGAAGLAAAHDEHDEGEGEHVRVLAERDIVERLDGEETRATVVEVTLAPGQEGEAHRHPGPTFGYVLEGEYEWAVDDQPARVLRAGETFYEPSGCLHLVSRNPASEGMTRVIAVVLHPREATHIVIPEPKE